MRSEARNRGPKLRAEVRHKSRVWSKVGAKSEVRNGGPKLRAKVRSRAAKAAGEMWSWQKKPFPYIRSSSSAAILSRPIPKSVFPSRPGLGPKKVAPTGTLAVFHFWWFPGLGQNSHSRSIFQVSSLRRKDVAIGVGGVVSEPAGSDIHARWAMVVDR